MLVLMVGFALSTSAQQISKVNFDSIYQATKDASSKLYYVRLMDRYRRNDPTLTNEEYKYLYYGYTGQDNYTPYRKNTKRKELNEVIQAENYTRMVDLGREILFVEPFSLDALFAVSEGYAGLKRRKEAELWGLKFTKLSEVILASGDGKTKETAFVVSHVSDEFAITSLLGLTVKNYSSIENRWDLLDLEMPNEINVKSLYFNVEKPVAYLKKTEAKKGN
jgi:hypothetical protein